MPRYQNKPVPLSQQIRLANLPQAARLELVQASRSPTVISVALQLPQSRLTQKFASNTSLWEILRYFESGDGANYNFTQRGVAEMSGGSGAGRLNYEMPVITVMPGHKEQSTLAELQQTLSQLGFDSGSALLKLTFRNSGRPLEEAMTQITHYFQTADAGVGGQAGAPPAAPSMPPPPPPPPSSSMGDAGGTGPEAADGVADGIAQHGEAAGEATTGEDSTSGAGHVAERAMGRPRRAVQIFSAPASSTPQAARDGFEADDYQPTVEHAKAHQAALVAKQRNTRLLSDRELEEQEQARQAKRQAAADKGGVVRIRMPDGTLVQMGFTQEDTAAGLYDVVAGLLKRKTERFQLKYTGPTGRLVLLGRDDQRLAHDLHFFANQLVTFQWADDASAEARASRQTLTDACSATSRRRREPSCPMLVPAGGPLRAGAAAKCRQDR